MKYKFRTLALILAFVLCFSAFSVSVFADEEAEPGTEYTESTSEEEPTQDDSTDTEPTYEEPTYEEPTYEEPTYEEPTYEDPTYEDPTYSYEATPSYDEPDYYPEDDNVASQNIDIIDVTDEVDTNMLTAADWEQIKLSLAESGDVGGEGGSDNFNFIKKNESKTDNGHWIVILAIVFFVCAAASLAIFVVLSREASAVKKKLGRQRRSGKPSADEYGDSYDTRRRSQNGGRHGSRR